MSPRIANLLLLLAGMVWGMGFVAQETALEDMGPMLFTGLRFLLAGLVVLPFAIREQINAKTKLSLGSFKWLLPIGVIFFLALALQQVGLMTTNVTKAGFLTALYVLFVPLILFVILREKQVWIIWPAALLALTGIYMLSGGEISSLNGGDWLMVVGAVFWAVHVILMGKVVVKMGTPVTMATSQFLICGCLGVLGYFAAPLTGIPEPVASLSMIREALPEILYAGIFAGALAFSLQAIAQQYTAASSAAILLSSESLFAALFGAILLGERLSIIGYLGCGLIFLAMVLVELKPSRAR